MLKLTGKHRLVNIQCGFGLLERLVRLTSKVLDFAYESLIMVSKNKANLSKDQLGKDEMKMTTESVRKGKQKQRKLSIEINKNLSKKLLLLQSNIVGKEQN